MMRIFVTGAGSAAAVAVIRALEHHADLFVGDVDPYAAGLYLVPEARRFIVRRGNDPGYTEAMAALCAQQQIALFIPLTDTELAPVAATRAAFEAVGTRTLVASSRTLAVSLDTAALMDTCREVCSVPRTQVLGDGVDLRGWMFPALVKSRSGVGSHNVRIVASEGALAEVSWTGALLLQEYLPGATYAVDVLADRMGRVLATVPRESLSRSSRLGVTARTFHDPELQRIATVVAERIGLTFAGTIRFRRNIAGVPTLVDVTARFSDAVALTVASGVHTPRLAVELALGHAIPAKVGTFRDTAVVRYWDDRVVDPSAVASMEQSAVAATALKGIGMSSSLSNNTMSSTSSNTSSSASNVPASERLDRAVPTP